MDDKDENKQGEDAVQQPDEQDISSEEIQRMAQNVGNQKGQNSLAQAQQDEKTQALEEEILSSFNKSEGDFDEAVESLGDAGVPEAPKEQAIDLTGDGKDLSEIVEDVEKSHGEPKTEGIPQDESFPYPSVPSKKTTEEGAAPSLEEVSSSPKPPETLDTAPLAPQGSVEPDSQAIENLSKDIDQHFQSQETPLESNSQTGESQPSLEETQARTYYHDISDAMGSDKPQTMSELLKKSAYERKESSILSPTSRKNLIYILGTVALLLISVAVWFFAFRPEANVSFITNERVSSLVHADEDLGLNTTDLGTYETRESIRDVLERKHDDDSLSQVYYVREDGMSNLRRMGIKSLFEKTQSDAPELLYENIEDEFMHGVYTTDKNYPFIILKATSYDRAFEGMKQWEPTMIDDLATYLNLPPEAADRSLLQDGFSYDVIKNKNVRVARFIPRSYDQRGILDFLKSDGSEFQQEETTPPETDTVTRLEKFFGRVWKPHTVFAQTPSQEGDTTQQGIGGTFLDDSLSEGEGATTTICYQVTRYCIDLNTGENLPPTTTPSATVACYDSVVNNGQTYTPEEVAGQSGYSCMEVLSSGDVIGYQETLYTEPVCFSPTTGDRIPIDSDSTSAVCFLPYQCRAIGCDTSGNNCQVTDQVVSLDAEIEKSCVQFNDLLNTQSIDDLNLCFDQFGNFVPAGSDGAVQCISPQARYERLCMTTTGAIIPGIDESGEPISVDQTNVALCFEPFSGGSLGDELNSSLNQDIRQIAAGLAHQLDLLADLASGFGAFNNSVSDTLREASDVFWDIAHANILENDIVLAIAETARNLEELLNVIDPTGTSQSEVVQGLRDIINVIREVVGLQNNVGWVTLGNDLPQGVDIHPGDELSSGPALEAVQEALVLLGLMDQASVNGELDLVTQQALVALEAINGLTNFVNAEGEIVIDQVFVSAEVLDILQDMVVSASAGIYGGGTTVAVNDFINSPLGLGSYGDDVLALQLFLYGEGYQISSFDGIFDEELCLALQQYQIDNGLVPADSISCELSPETITFINEEIRNKNYLGSGFTVQANGALEGNGVFLGTFGPGTPDFSVNEAEASSLREGDVVLLYTFLDEETILITRSEAVITEIIERRALSDIFNDV